MTAESCSRFLNARCRGLEVPDGSSAFAQAHALLLEATFCGEKEDYFRLRRPSLCLDGTPIVYSHKIGRFRDDSAFRILTEPGGIEISTAEQIDWSLQTLDRLLTLFGWEVVASEINSIAAEVFPQDVKELSTWWGGIWLGLNAGESGTEIRFYANLRYGDAQDRWRRVARILGVFGDESLEVPLQELANRSAPYSIPVGLGVVVANGRIPVLRIYSGIHQPNKESFTAFLPTAAAKEQALFTKLRNLLGDSDGRLRSQSVTAAYDFRRDGEGTILPAIARTKLDFSCASLSEERVQNFLSLTNELSSTIGLESSGFQSFTDALAGHFGGFDFEYLSLGFAETLTSVAIYAKPHDLHGYTQTAGTG